MKELTFITSHPQKAKELAWHLNTPVIHHKLDLIEIQSLDPHVVVSAKAIEAYRLLKRPVLVEDFSLRFEALGKLPGPLIKWFLAELQLQGLCNLLQHYDNPYATAQVCFALCDEDGVVIFDGAVKGTITKKPYGDDKFGTDSIFMPNGWSKTWGEMSKAEQIATSVRRIALEKLQAYLAPLKETFN